MPDLKITKNEPCGTGMRRITFDRPLDGFDIPGQFCTVHLEGHKPGYFALASCPGFPTELLVKVAGDTAEALAALPIGSAVEFSDPIGKGFHVDPDDMNPLVILAAGSGLSAVRSLIDAELTLGLRRPVHLFYGVFTPDHAAYADKLDDWRAAGVDVRMVVSEDVPWNGMRGFVQHAAHKAGFVRSDTTVVLCGFPAMVDDAKRMWTEAGAEPEQILTNF